jgi:Bacteriophage minor capsid protein
MAEVPPSDILRGLLTAHVGASGWALETGAMPNDPDRIIMLTDTVGIEPNPKFLLDFPTCQILVRGPVSGYRDAYREAKAVKDLLLGVDPFTTGDGDRMVSITQNGDLGSIGRDESMRPLFTINFALIIEPQVVGNSNRIAL